jgi:diguanylate cyclase (GGDEF)-like protein/PAS domain S-box-containing protein
VAEQAERIERLTRLRLSARRNADGAAVRSGGDRATRIADESALPAAGTSAVRYRSIFAKAAVSIICTTTDGRIIEANEEFAAMLGYESESLLGRTDCSLIHPDDRGGHECSRGQLVAGHEASRSAEMRYLCKDGRTIWVNRTATLVSDAANESPYIVQVLEDVSERKHAEIQVARLLRAREVTAACHRILVHAADETGMLREMCRVAVQLGGYMQVWIGLVTGVEKVPVRVAAHAGYGNGVPLPMTSSAVFDSDGRYVGKMAEAVATGAYAIERDMVRQAARVDQRERAIKNGWGSALTLPLVSDGCILGGFELNAHEPDAFDTDEIVLLGELAADIAFCVSALRAKIAREQAEHQLREHERRFQAIFEHAAVGISHTALSGEFILANRKFCAILGYDEKELIGRHFAQFTHPDDRTRDLRDRQLMLEGKLTHCAREKRFVRKNGEVIWTHRTTSVARDPAGNPLHFIAVVEDISERKELERRFRETFDQAAVGIVHTSFDGRYLQVNRRFCEMVGYEAHELIGRPAAAFTHPEDRDKRTDYRQLMWDGKLEKLIEEKRYLRKDGSVLWTNRTVSLARDGAGRPMYFIRVIEDISERRGIEERYRTTFDNAPVGIMHTAVDGYRILRANRKLADMLGYAQGELLSMTSTDLVHPDCRFADRGKYYEQLLRGDIQSYASERDFVRKDGSKVRVNRTVSLVRDASGNPDYFIRIIEDITERTLSEQRRDMEHAIAAVLAESPTVQVAMPRIIQTICKALGWACGMHWQWDEPAELLRCVDHWHVEHGAVADFVASTRDSVNEAPAWSGRAPGTKSGGLVRGVWLAGEPVWIADIAERAGFRRGAAAARAGLHCAFGFPILAGDRPLGVMEFFSRDIKQPDEALLRAVQAIGRQLGQFTQRKRAEEGLVRLAHYDTLTDLPNRVLFYDRLKQALALAKRNSWITGVMFMDVDRFKNINDTLGHALGDELLRLVSERLVGSVRASDTVGRLGGDEFGIVLSNLSDPLDAGVVAQKIIASFARPFKLAGTEVYVTPSIGITLYPKDASAQDELIKHADAAMYRAKESGRNNFQYYSPEMSARGRSLLELEGKLRRAIENEEFLLHYQPKASVATGKITGFEALLRWQRPGIGLISPAEFVPILEETGLIVQAGAWVLNAVCAQISAWQHAGIEPVPIAVNLSARQFLQPDLGPMIRRIIESNGVAPAFIELEITESSLMANPQEATRTLEFLKSLGLALSIDDFGTGYSSLSYLKRFPLDALKVDRSFVRDITTDANDAAITLAVISMAHSLGLKVIAEGVETSEQLAFLAEHRCDQVQGYYFARPLPGADCSRFLAEDRRLKLAG